MQLPIEAETSRCAWTGATAGEASQWQQTIPAELVAALLDFPKLIASSNEAREPQRLAASLHETARLVHNWYHKVRVLEAPDGVREARLALARAAQIVLRNGLTILGISAPERM